MEQHMAALASANEVRFTRAKMHGRVKRGELEIAEVLLADPRPAWARRLEIGELLTWEPGIGRARAEKMLMGLARPTLRLERIGHYTASRIVQRLCAYREHSGA